MNRKKLTTIFYPLIKYIDLLFIVLILSFLINELILPLISLIDFIYNYYNTPPQLVKDVIYNMASTNNVNTSASHSTDVRVIHDDGSWANTIKSLFIYGSGALRLQLARGGTPARRARTFIIASTIATDVLAKFVNNTINDPAYVRSHFENWSAIWENGKDGVAKLNLDKETSKKLAEALNSTSTNENISTSCSSNFAEAGVVNKLTIDSSGYLPLPLWGTPSVATPATTKLEEWGCPVIPSSSNSYGGYSCSFREAGVEDIPNNIIKYIMDIIRPILEPVITNYSNEILANQIYDLSILLFILSILISILILGLLINILVLINSNRILNFFTNKYIRWYVNVNMKLIGIEVLCLGSSILYFMFTLSKGLQYIATHPIIFN